MKFQSTIVLLSIFGPGAMAAAVPNGYQLSSLTRRGPAPPPGEIKGVIRDDKSTASKGHDDPPIHKGKSSGGSSSGSKKKETTPKCAKC
jgi:hypothetical protein